MRAALTTVVILGVAVLLVAAPHRTASQEPKKTPPLPKDITWKLDVLDKAPLKVISTQFEPKTHAVFWVIELARDLDVYEDGVYWAPAFKELRPRFRFELHDADGIVLKTVDARYIGEYVNRGGKRFGALLVLPKELVKEIKTVEVVPN